MSYQALARKWRPHTFSELVGQEHVVRALSNALDHDRLHHAYLFTGTRGVGKTTIARILAKSLNCEQGVSSSPCGHCSSCEEIDAGRFVDLLEIDAASKTGVDDTRELLENVPYAPVRGRYKVYLIDEVHMFSNHSFNALLKTLEEPPPHVKFLLATTDPKKLPVTVLSRCLQFNLKRLEIAQIREQFQKILATEQVNAEPAALEFLARMADGSMRDGLSILDQAISYGGGAVREAETRTMMGAAALDRLPQLLQHVQSGEAEKVLAWVEESSSLVPDYSGTLKELILLLHRIALLQAVPDAGDSNWGDVDSIRCLAEQMAPEDTQLYYQISLHGQRDLHLAADPRSGFEMTLLRMLAFRPFGGSDTDVSVKPPAVKQESTTLEQSAQANQQAKQQAKQQEKQQPPAENVTATGGSCDWHQVLPQLRLGGMSAQLASHCSVRQWNDKGLVLNLDPKCKSLMGPVAVQRLQSALDQYCGRSVKLEIELGAGEIETPAERQIKEQQARQAETLDSMQNDPMVRGLESAFDAQLIKESVKSVDS